MYEEPGKFKHMAWIPIPCGAFDSLGTLVDGSGRPMQITTTVIRSKWRQRTGERSESRMAGMMSLLNARLLAEERMGCPR